MSLRFKRQKVALLLVLSLLLSSFTFLAGEQRVMAEENSQNLVQNGSFELVNNADWANSWNTWAASGAPQFVVDAGQAYEGSRSVAISASSTSRGAITQRISIPENLRSNTFRLQQMIKTEDLTATAYFRIQAYDQSGARIVSYYTESSRLTGTNDWTLVELEINLLHDVYSVQIESFMDGGIGTAWFDDMQLHVVENSEAELENLLENGDFENVNAAGNAENWGTYTFNGEPVFGIDEEVMKEGERSYKVQAETQSRATVVQNIYPIAAQKGKTYKFQQWIKTEDFNGNAYFRTQIYDATGQRVQYIESTRITGTNDWTLIELVVDIGQNVHRIQWESFFDAGTGTVWFDDTRIFHWIPVEEITLDPDEIQLTAGESITLDTVISPENATDQELVWSSSHPEVAEVADGVVTAQSDGMAIITARAEGSDQQGSAIVIVGESSGITASNTSVETNQDVSVSGSIEASSDIGSALSYSKLIESMHGYTRLDENGDWVYFPNAGFSGTDYFLILIEDEQGNFAASRVSITVHPVNQPPVAQNRLHSEDKNTPITGIINATDPDGDVVTFSVAQDSEHGTLTLESNGRYSYTPELDFTGEDTFTVLASDSHGNSSEAKVRLYFAPKADEIIAELKQNNPGERQPRMMASEDDFSRIRQLQQTDENMEAWIERLQMQAENFLLQPNHPYNKPDGLRLSTTSAGMVVNLAMAYHITGDERYAQRAINELLHVSSDAYPDWSPEHFLDTATMTYGVSLGYDWLYNVMDEQERASIREAIITKGLEPSLPTYQNKAHWTVNTANWNFVCNAGMLMGALAIADEAEEISGTILNHAFKSLQYGITQYGPDGSAIEGPAYWEYGTIYLVYLFSSLETVFGHDFGFTEADGIIETPQFPIDIAGAQGVFNYADNGYAFIPGRLLLWFANRFDEPDYAWYHQFVNEKMDSNGWQDILWYRPELYDGGEPSHLDKYFERPKTVSMRSSWTDPYARFAGFKGGVNGSPHGDLDIGSFVLDALGKRWAVDFGSEDYNLPGYWSMGEEGARWTYYRKRAEGHNTLIINPSAKPDQRARAVSEIIAFEENASQGAYAIADMTPAYADSVASAKRGFALIDHRRQFLVQDEIQGKLPVELYWFMHTAADIEIIESGQVAILSEGDKRLWVELLTPAEAGFTIMDADPLPSSPNPSGQTPNTGYKKLAIHLEDVLDTTISVWMVPLMPGQDVPIESPEVVPLAEWSVPDSKIAELNGILLNDQPLESFLPHRYTYEVMLPYGEEIPAIEGVSSDYAVAVQEIAEGTYQIEVTDEVGDADSGLYFVQFTFEEETIGDPLDQEPTIGKPDDSEQRKLNIISAQASEHDGNTPSGAIDGNMSTRWSASGEQWIEFDLGESKRVQDLAIAWFSGDQRSSIFDVKVSDNRYVWEWVYTGQSSGVNADFETYNLREATGRYVRIEGYGNTANGWNSIVEVELYGEDAAQIPIPDSVSGMAEMVENYRQEFASEEAFRAQRIHLTAVQLFAERGDAARVAQHMESYSILLDHQFDEELISEDLYQALTTGIGVILNDLE